MFADFTELFSVHCCTGRQGFTSIILLFPLLFLSAVIAVVRRPSGLLKFSIVFCTNNNTRRAIAQINSATAYVRSTGLTLNCFFIASAISALMVETPIFAVISLSYSLTVAKTVEANFRIFLIAFFILLHFLLHRKSGGYVISAQLLRSPASSDCAFIHLGASCPVVTPSPKGLGSAFSVCLYYIIFAS